ncbi:MAG: hypothetical protein FWD57_07100 [Polyangiaceae bacterium]|nr:hypothetical protein [Polyangiaceae bacterium]
MNTNMVQIVRRIIADRGEAIFADAQLLAAVFCEYAQNEPRDERTAFGRCIENNAYGALKSAVDWEQRRQWKIAIAARVSTIYGISNSLTSGAMDVLEAALFGSAPPVGAGVAGPVMYVTPNLPNSNVQSSIPAASSVPPSGNPPSGIVCGPGATVIAPTVPSGARLIIPPATGVSSPGKGSSLFARLVGGRPLALAGAAAVCVFIVILIFDPFKRGSYGPYSFSASYLFAVVQLMALSSMFVSIALLAAHSIVQKRFPSNATILNTAAIAFVLGGMTGLFFDMCCMDGRFFSSLPKQLTFSIAFGVLGSGIGLSVSGFLPNYAKHHAAMSGFAGGLFGSALFYTVAYMVSDEFSYPSALACAFVGFFVAFIVIRAEQPWRTAWITVSTAAPMRVRSIGLGASPIIFGSSPMSHVLLPSPNTSPIRAMVQIENAQIVMYDTQTNQRHVLQHGQRVDLDRIDFTVGIKNVLK